MAFLVAAVANLIVAIDRLSIVFVLLTIADAALSLVFIIQYEKGRNRKKE